MALSMICSSVAGFFLNIVTGPKIKTGYTAWPPIEYSVLVGLSSNLRRVFIMLVPPMGHFFKVRFFHYVIFQRKNQIVWPDAELDFRPNLG